jgi:N-acetylglucosaminyl-diphospho-decaprenol L-rhamnosyltransferase
MSLDLAVIIVTWNVRELALNALQTLYDDLAQSGLSARVIVVDSASSDGSAEAVAEAFPQATVIASKENLGFGRANNVGLREAGFEGDQPKPRAVYLLNPDTLTIPGATRTMFDALMSDSRIGLVGARLSYEDASFQHSAFAFPGLRQLWAEFFPTPGRFIEGRFNGRYPHHLYEQGKPFEIGFPLGATWMLRREVIERTGMFDERFFMYGEEVDWAWRIHKAGWQVMCVPAAHVVHLAGKSTTQVRPQSIVNLWTSRLTLFQKHYPAWKLAIARQMIAVGMARKAAHEENAEVRAAYERVRVMSKKLF